MPMFPSKKKDMACGECGQAPCMCHGGKMMSKGGEMGVHKPSFSNENHMGASESGDVARQARHNKNHLSPRKIGQMASVKEDHRRVLHELKEMPKPKLQGLAEGGMVKDKMGNSVRHHVIKKVHDHMRKKNISSDEASPNTFAENAREAGHHDLESHEVIHGSDTYAKGGQVENMHDMPEMKDHEMDDALNDMIAEELMQAFEKKDKKGILEAIQALVLSCKE